MCLWACCLCNSGKTLISLCHSIIFKMKATGLSALRVSVKCAALKNQGDRPVFRQHSSPSARNKSWTVHSSTLAELLWIALRSVLFADAACLSLGLRDQRLTQSAKQDLDCMKCLSFSRVPSILS